MLRIIFSLALTVVSVTSLQCYSNEHYQPPEELHAIVCGSQVNSCVKHKLKGKHGYREFGSSAEVLSFSCDIYEECYDGDGKKILR